MLHQECLSSGTRKSSHWRYVRDPCFLHKKVAQNVLIHLITVAKFKTCNSSTCINTEIRPHYKTKFTQQLKVTGVETLNLLFQNLDCYIPIVTFTTKLIYSLPRAPYPILKKVYILLWLVNFESKPTITKKKVYFIRSKNTHYGLCNRNHVLPYVTQRHARSFKLFQLL